MNLAPEVKKNAFKTHGKSEFDSGSTEAQVALFTMKIQHLTEHLKINKKDNVTVTSLKNLAFVNRLNIFFIKQERGNEILASFNI